MLRQVKESKPAASEVSGALEDYRQREASGKELQASRRRAGEINRSLEYWRAKSGSRRGSEVSTMRTRKALFASARASWLKFRRRSRNLTARSKPLMGGW